MNVCTFLQIYFFFYLYRYGKHTNSNKNQYLRNMQRTTKKKQIKYEQQKRSHEKKSFRIDIRSIT